MKQAMDSWAVMNYGIKLLGSQSCLGGKSCSDMQMLQKQMVRRVVNPEVLQRL